MDTERQRQRETKREKEREIDRETDRYEADTCKPINGCKRCGVVENCSRSFIVA